MAWYLAPSLAAARRELNELFPDRDKASDGTIGDTAHSSRKSDHNPDADGSVNAWDVTHDPDGGPDCNDLVDHIVKRRDSRVAYLIWDGRIWRSYDKPGLPAWTPEKYTGTNPHTKHAHISVKHDRTSEQDTSTWWDGLPSRSSSLLSFTLPDEEDDVKFRSIKRVEDGAIALVAAGYFKHVSLGQLSAAIAGGLTQQPEDEVNAAEWDIIAALVKAG